jgi:hypothetical protein
MKPNKLPSRPRHIRIYDEDWDFLDLAFGRNSPKPVGATAAVRSIVHSYCKRLKEKAQIAEGTEDLKDE